MVHLLHRLYGVDAPEPGRNVSRRMVFVRLNCSQIEDESLLTTV